MPNVWILGNFSLILKRDSEKNNVSPPPPPPSLHIVLISGIIHGGSKLEAEADVLRRQNRKMERIRVLGNVIELVTLLIMNPSYLMTSYHRKINFPIVLDN